MFKRYMTIFLGFIGLMSANIASTHHSAAVIFEMDKTLTIEGTVTRFQLGNPHARIFLNIENEAGEIQEWMAEGGSRTVLTRLGWTEDDLKVGDIIQIIGNPSRDGSTVFHWKTLIFPDGSERYGEDLDPSITESLRNKRR